MPVHHFKKQLPEFIATEKAIGIEKAIGNRRLFEAPFIDYKNAIGNSNLKGLFELAARNSNVIMIGH